jgi:hypothetical protein
MSDGLRQLPSDEGVIAWTVMSAPTLVNQKGFQCYDDAFVIIQAAEAKDDWTITLYSHNTRESKGFITKTFRFFTGASLDSAVVASTITGASGRNSHRGPPNIKQQADVTSVASSDSPMNKMNDITRAIRSPFVQLLAGKIRKKLPSDRSFVKL